MLHFLCVDYNVDKDIRRSFPLLGMYCSLICNLHGTVSSSVLCHSNFQTQLFCQKAMEHGAAGLGEGEKLKLSVTTSTCDSFTIAVRLSLLGNTKQLLQGERASKIARKER